MGSRSRSKPGEAQGRPVPVAGRIVVDVGLALVLLVLGLVASRWAATNQPAARPLDLPGYALIATTAVVLAGRWRWPGAVLVIASAATAGYLVSGYPYGPIMAAFSVAVYGAAALLPPRRCAVLAGAALVAMSLHVFVPADGDPGLAGLLPALAWVVVPLAIGVIVRVNRDTRTRVERERTRRIADEERLRIAQEVHDVVGHGLAAINMQAEIALHLLARKPEQAEVALTAISRTSKEALDELRATLGVLRRGEDRTPTPGLAQLAALRSRLADAGLPVTLTVRGDSRDLPAVVDLAGYRIVQEALTNVLHHAGTATATVLVEHTPEAVVIDVTDSGDGSARVGRSGGRVGSEGMGSGLAGMRERVTALGGALAAGPRPEGGFRVHAVLPISPGGQP